MVSIGKSVGNNLCPSGGIIEYRNGKFICLVHSKTDGKGNDGDEGGKPCL